MNKTAYDECYYGDMIQKTRYLFKLIARNTEEPFSLISEYLKSDYRKQMDRGNPLYLNKTPKQILGALGVEIRVKYEISEMYDEAVMEWMADVYTYMQWKYNCFSRELAEKLKPEELYKKYHPLHEASVSNCGAKLAKFCGI